MNTSTSRRVCTKCLKKRPVGEFHQSPWCSKCRSNYFKEYNKRRYRTPEARQGELKRGREKYWRLVRAGRMERKRQLILLMGGKCVRCGYDKSAAALDFHHRNVNEKRRNISQLLAVNQEWGFKAAIEEARKCELICANCHREETYPGHNLQVPIIGGQMPATYKHRPRRPNHKRNIVGKDRLLTFRGETLTMLEWTARLGFGRQTLRDRLRHGWSIKRALATPRTRGPNGERLGSEKT